MSLAQIILLLQLSLSLLVNVSSNPATTEQKQQALGFATQAINLATQSLQNQAVSQTVISSTNLTNTPSPTQVSTIPPQTPPASIHAPLNISEVRITGITLSYANIAWSSNESATFKVLVDGDNRLYSIMNSMQEPSGTWDYQAVLGPLKINTQYSFIVSGVDSIGNSASTSPCPFGTPNSPVASNITSFCEYSQNNQQQTPPVVNVPAQPATIDVSYVPERASALVVPGGAGPFGHFAFKTGNDPIEIKYLTFEIQFTGGTVTSSQRSSDYPYRSSLSSAIQNIQLQDDAGQQIGAHIPGAPSSNTCDLNGTSQPAGVPQTDVYYDCFGGRSNPINYVIPANTTRILTITSELPLTARFQTASVSLTGNADNLLDLTTNAIGNSSAIAGVSGIDTAVLSK